MSLIRIPALGCLGSIHSDVKSGIVELLLNAQIRQTGDMPKLAQYGVSDSAIGLQILPFDLHIHGSRESKVEDLSGHVRGQEVESSAGERAGQGFSKIANVIGRRVVFLAERNQYVGISRAYGSGCVVHVIELAVREADIVGNARHLLTGNLRGEWSVRSGRTASRCLRSAFRSWRACEG